MDEIKFGTKRVLFCGFALFLLVSSAVVLGGLLGGGLLNYSFPSVGLGPAVLCGSFATGMGLWTLMTIMQMFVTMKPELQHELAAMGDEQAQQAFEEDDDGEPLLTDDQVEFLAEHVSAQLMDRFEERSARHSMGSRRRREAELAALAG